MVAMAASVTTVLLNSFWGRLVPRLRGRPAAVECVSLTVPTIHCQGCVGIIQEELGKLPNVVSVEGDADTKRVTVTTRDGHGQRRVIEQALTRLGHVVGEE
jgi:copper chaperone CopZ